MPPGVCVNVETTLTWLRNLSDPDTFLLQFMHVVEPPSPLSPQSVNATTSTSGTVNVTFPYEGYVLRWSTHIPDFGPMLMVVTFWKDLGRPW